MIWAKITLAGGVLVLLGAFAVGTENELSTSVAGQAQACGPSISASWLVPGTPDRTSPGPAATSNDRRTAAVCGPVVHESRLLIVTILGLGCLLVLVGSGVVRARGLPPPRAATPAQS